MNVQIEESWKEALQSEFDKPYFASLVQYLHKEKAEGRQVFPPGKDIFKAFELTPVDKVKVVILGQDPYHGYGQAMGLSFSVPAYPCASFIEKYLQGDRKRLGCPDERQPGFAKMGGPGSAASECRPDSSRWGAYVA